MQKRLLAIVAAFLWVVVLTACADVTTPESTATRGSTPSATATPSRAPSSSASPSEAPTSGSPSATMRPVDEPPQRVSGVTTQEGGGSGEVLVRWNQSSVLDVVSYTVWRASTPNGSFTQIGSVTREEVTEFEYVPFVDSTATVAFYEVRAVDSAGQSGPPSLPVCGASVGNSC